MIRLLSGYYTMRSGKRVNVDLDEESGFLYVTYRESGRRVKFNQERYTAYSDFLFLNSYFTMYRRADYELS